MAAPRLFVEDELFTAPVNCYSCNVQLTHKVNSIVLKTYLVSEHVMVCPDKYRHILCKKCYDSSNYTSPDWNKVVCEMCFSPVKIDSSGNIQAYSGIMIRTPQKLDVHKCLCGDRKCRKEFLSEVEEYNGGPLAKVCVNCGKGSLEMKKCGRCRVIRYCNQECQRAHWPVHKKDCSPP